MSQGTKLAARRSLEIEATERAATEGSMLRPVIHLDLSYQLPPCSPLCEQDEKRLTHEDLQAMAVDDLTAECWRLRFVLAFGDLSQRGWAYEWLNERLNRCIRLLRGR